MTNETASFELSPARRANVIWIISDQLRAQSLGYRGDSNVRTPNIDNLARIGMRFDAAVSGSPWCSPFRAAMLTGLYPHQNGVAKAPAMLNPTIPAVAESFNRAGYQTIWMGKWHLDGSNDRTHYVPPQRRGGFTFWRGYENNNNQNECYVYGTGQETPERLAAYETDALTDQMIQYLRKHRSVRHGDEEYQPFFAVLSVQPPHSPYVPPTVSDNRYGCRPDEMKLRPNVPVIDRVREKALFDLAGYYGMIENLDMNIGKLRQALKEMDMDRETYLVFFSDHGDCLGSHAQWGKSSPWEEAIRIPFIVAKEDGRTPMKKGISEAVLNHVDIAPTTLGLCGIPVPADMLGYDYSRQCRRSGATEQEKHQPEPDSAYLQQITRKYQAHSVNQAWRGVLMRDGWKYVCVPGHDWLLFDTKNDPYEMANRCYDIAFEKQRERCHARLQQWISETGDAFELPLV